MKLVKGSFVMLILLTSLQLCFGQEKSEALLFDRFGNYACGDIMARADALFAELMRDPQSHAYVVISPRKNSIKEALRLERIINASIYLRRVDKSQITLIRNKENNFEEAIVEFWKVPFDAEKPSFVEERWAETTIALTKPFIFGSIWNDDSCPLFIPENYAKLIKENPNLRGHIVIFNPSKKESRNEMKQWLNLLTEEYKVPRNRLKIFFASRRKNGIPDVEFWIVPYR
jgi:hypothetical protein